MIRKSLAPPSASGDRSLQRRNPRPQIGQNGLIASVIAMILPHKLIGPVAKIECCKVAMLAYFLCRANFKQGVLTWLKTARLNGATTRLIRGSDVRKFRLAAITATPRL